MNQEFGEEEEVGLSYYGRGQILLIRLLRVGGIESTSNDFGGGAVLRAARGEDPHPRPLSRKGRGGSNGHAARCVVPAANAVELAQIDRQNETTHRMPP